VVTDGFRHALETLVVKSRCPNSICAMVGERRKKQIIPLAVTDYDHTVMMRKKDSNPTEQ